MRNVIVGVDGTESSTAALRWAAQTVGTEGRLHAVVSINPWTEHLVEAIAGEQGSYGAGVAGDMVHRWTADTGFAVGELVASVSRHSVADALDGAATHDRADAIVIGAHHTVGGVVKRVGHATNRLMQTTTSPVVVVPADNRASPIEGGTVVVGIGHGNATRSAVRWAARLARSIPISVELVHAMGDAPVFQANGVLDLVRYEVGNVDRSTWRRGEIEHFAELMQVLTGPELDMAVRTPPGLAALRLDEASDRSSLLVVGRHRSRLDGGRHTAQPLRHVLTHARCPVAVITEDGVDERDAAC